MIRWRTRHQATTMTRINKVENFDRAVTETTKVWRVKEVREDGSMVLEQSIDQLELSQSVGGGEEIRYDSQADEQPPIRFESIAGSVGVPLALVTISPRARCLKKKRSTNRVKWDWTTSLCHCLKAESRSGTRGTLPASLLQASRMVVRSLSSGERVTRLMR